MSVTFFSPHNSRLCSLLSSCLSQSNFCTPFIQGTLPFQEHSPEYLTSLPQPSLLSVHFFVHLTSLGLTCTLAFFQTLWVHPLKSLTVSHPLPLSANPGSAKPASVHIPGLFRPALLDSSPTMETPAQGSACLGRPATSPSLLPSHPALGD